MPKTMLSTKNMKIVRLQIAILERVRLLRLRLLIATFWIVILEVRKLTMCRCVMFGLRNVILPR